MAVSTKMAVFLVMLLCNLVEFYRRGTLLVVSLVKLRG